MFKNNTYISKDETKMLKGSAILIMVWLHLFLPSNIHNGTEVVPLTSFFDSQGDYIFFHRFTVITVPLYMLLSGYGLWVVYNRKSNMGNFKRILFLLIKSSIVACFFYPIAYFYPNLDWHFGNGEFLANITGFRPYNAEWWFIFPWMILCFLSPFLMKSLKNNTRLLIITCLVLYIIGKYFAHKEWIYSYRTLFELDTVAINLTPFMFGALAAKSGIVSYCSKALTPLIGLSLSFLLIFIRCRFVHNGFADPLVALLYVMSIIPVLSKMGNSFRKVFLVLGSESTNIWLIHTFICVYYFSNFVFLFRYPILIFVVTLALSYFFSVMLSKLQNLVINTIKKDENCSDSWRIR